MELSGKLSGQFYSVSLLHHPFDCSCHCKQGLTTAKVLLYRPTPDGRLLCIKPPWRCDLNHHEKPAHLQHSLGRMAAITMTAAGFRGCQFHRAHSPSNTLGFTSSQNLGHRRWQAQTLLPSSSSHSGSAFSSARAPQLTNNLGVGVPMRKSTLSSVAVNAGWKQTLRSQALDFTRVWILFNRGSNNSEMETGLSVVSF
jgi:hypothetical protein